MPVQSTLSTQPPVSHVDSLPSRSDSSSDWLVLSTMSIAMMGFVCGVGARAGDWTAESPRRMKTCRYAHLLMLFTMYSASLTIESLLPFTILYLWWLSTRVCLVFISNRSLNQIENFNAVFHLGFLSFQRTREIFLSFIFDSRTNGWTYLKQVHYKNHQNIFGEYF